MSKMFPASAWAKLGLRLTVALALLWFVLNRALRGEGEGGLSALLTAWNPGPMASERPSPWLTLAFAVVIIGVGFGLNALRFRGLLRAAGAMGSWGSLLRAYLVAGFFNLVLPGAILGDAYRIVDAKQLAGGTSEALGLVLLERLLGLSALGSIGLFCIPLLPMQELGESGIGWLAIGLGTAFLLGTFLILYPPSNQLLIRTCLRLLPGWLSLPDASTRALAQVGRMWHQPRVLLQTFGLSLVAQGLLVLSLWVLGQSLSDRVEWYWFPLIIPFATLVSLVPISIGAAGVREYLYVTLFGLAGMQASSALALSLSIFAATLFWGLIGLLLFCLGRLQGQPEVRRG